MTANEIEALNGYDGATPIPEDFVAFWQAPAGFAQAWAETVAVLQPEVQFAPVPFANPCGVYEQLTVTYQGRTVTARHPPGCGGAASPAIDVPRFEPQRARLAPHDAVSGAGLWYRGAGSRTLQGRLAGQARAGGFPHAVSGCAGRGQGRAGTALGGCGLRLHIWRGLWRRAGTAGGLPAARVKRCAALNPLPGDFSGLGVPGCEDIDLANFAPLCRAKVLLGSCLMDTYAPPQGQAAIYNRLTCPKQWKLYPKYIHERVNFFENQMLCFFKDGIV